MLSKGAVANSRTLPVKLTMAPQSGCCCRRAYSCPRSKSSVCIRMRVKSAALCISAPGNRWEKGNFIAVADGVLRSAQRLIASAEYIGPGQRTGPGFALLLQLLQQFCHRGGTGRPVQFGSV